MPPPQKSSNSRCVRKQLSSNSIYRFAFICPYIHLSQSFVSRLTQNPFKLHSWNLIGVLMGMWAYTPPYFCFHPSYQKWVIWPWIMWQAWKWWHECPLDTYLVLYFSMKKLLYRLMKNWRVGFSSPLIRLTTFELFMLDGSIPFVKR